MLIEQNLHAQPAGMVGVNAFAARKRLRKINGFGADLSLTVAIAFLPSRRNHRRQLRRAATPHTVSEYGTKIAPPTNVRGYLFIEHDPDPDWRQHGFQQVEDGNLRRGMKLGASARQKPHLER
ncbi:MAG: hypothetical protein R3D29_08070 [Nitratireductor sp.]